MAQEVGARSGENDRGPGAPFIYADENAGTWSGSKPLHVFIDRTRVMRPKDGSAEGAEKIIVSRTEPKDHKSSNGVLLLRNMVMSLTVSESQF